MKKIGLCALKQQQSVAGKDFFAAHSLENYKEKCLLHAVLSTVQKNLNTQNQRVQNFGIATGMPQLAEKCRQNGINILYVVKKEVPPLHKAAYGDIEIRFI